MDTKDNNTETTVVNVKVAFLRSGKSGHNGKKFDNLKEWVGDSDRNLYIGRRGIVFIDGHRYPPTASPLANPFKLCKSDPIGDVCGTRRVGSDVCRRYESYLRKRIEEGDVEILNELDKCIGKNLGCWCVDNKNKTNCHGFIIKKILMEKTSNTKNE
jgi:hypothetical protein